MIGIAILAIVLAIPRSARNSVQGLALEADSRRALRNARVNLDKLRRQGFDRLPPDARDGGPGLARFPRVSPTSCPAA